MRKDWVRAEELEIPEALHILISDKKIISVLSLVMPYIFNLWFREPIEDILRELQFIEANDNFGKGVGSSAVILII